MKPNHFQHPKPKYLFLLLLVASILTTFSLLSLYSWHLNINRPLYGFKPILEHSACDWGEVSLAKTDEKIDSLNRGINHGN